MIKFICGKNEREVSRQAAKIISRVIKTKPTATIGLATGSSPINTYEELIKMYRTGEISFNKVKSVNLDEYVGLSPVHEQSYAYFMWENFFKHIDINPQSTYIPSGISDDIDAECKRYDQIIASTGGIDIQILGIGHNGHIGFNEPSTCFSKSTSAVNLTDSTISANSRFFDSQQSVPTRAITMGIGQIMQAKRLVLLAFGKGKAEILKKALLGPVTPAIPASILQFFKGELTVCADTAALSLIKNENTD